MGPKNTTSKSELPVSSFHHTFVFSSLKSFFIATATAGGALILGLLAAFPLWPMGWTAYNS